MEFRKPLSISKYGGKNMKKENCRIVLFLISMLNIALFSELPERSVRIYLFVMPIWEFYLLLGFRKDEPPLKLLLAYFLTAAVFEFPSTLVGVLFSGFPLHALLLLPIALPWYLGTLLGLVITLKLLFRRVDEVVLQSTAMGLTCAQLGNYTQAILQLGSKISTGSAPFEQ